MRKRVIGRRILAALLSGMLALSGCPVLSVETVQAEENSDTELHNPVVEMNECDTVYFGNYWQEDTNKDGVADQEDEKTPIRWRILSRNGDDAYVIADQVLDQHPYNDEDADVTWETCTLRKWLNEDFFTAAFSEEEQDAVIEQTLVNADNEEFNTAGGNDTIDKVYLPSYSDMLSAEFGFQTDRLFCDQTRVGMATSYVYEKESRDGVKAIFWGLRSPGANAQLVSLVNRDGSVYPYGTNVGFFGIGIRPVLHLDLSSPFVSSAGKQEASVKSVTWDTVEFGNYGGNPIKWRVLKVADGKVYLLADKILMEKEYNDEEKDITWSESTLRLWLNESFYEEAFTETEKDIILSDKYLNADNGWF